MGCTHAFDTLPVEVIREIASHSPGESILALTATNKALREACNDHLVFQASVERGSGRSHFSSWWSPHSAATLVDWAHWALADSRAAALEEQSRWASAEADASYVKGISDYKNAFPELLPDLATRWLLHILVAGRPLLGVLPLQSLHTSWRCAKDFEGTRVPDHTITYKGRILKPSDRLVLTLSLAMCTLNAVPARSNADPLTPRPPSALADPAHHNPPEESRRPIKARLQDPRVWATVPDPDGAELNTLVALTTVHKHAHLAVAGLTGWLRVSEARWLFHHDGDARSHHGPDGFPAPPNAIPFSALMDPPAPFAAGDDVVDCEVAARLATCHLPAMASKAFLEDGEWIGYYSLGTGRGLTESFDPAMRGLHLEVIDEADNGTVHFRGTGGRDHVNAFTLEGKLDRASGKLYAQKIYPGHTWHWGGVMTPFGMIGEWGNIHGWEARRGGWFWLWKKAWSGQWER